MKTRKGSSVSLVTSNESWRSLTKGQTARVQKRQHEEARFKIAGYIRLSPSGEEREEGSLVSHPQRITNFVEDKNRREPWGEIIDWYIDKDYSGKDTNRPNFQRMLNDIRLGKINAVVVTELSRLSRSVKDFCELQEFFKAHRVAFFSLRESFDTSTPAGELMLMQTMAFAQFERHTIVDRIKKGARARAERGLGNGYVPLGYQLVPHRPNHREVCESEKAYVEMIFRKFLEIRRINQVVTYLNENGYKTKEFVTKDGRKVGGNRWTLSSLYSLLTNRTYIGQREFNKRNRTNDSSDLKEDERYFYVDAQWPALISEDMFGDVQRLLESNKKRARKYIHQYRLTGLVFCNDCGESLFGKSGNGRNGKYFYYGHNRKLAAKSDRHLHRCKVENISAIQLEEAIIGRLKELANDRSLIEEMAKWTASEHKAQVQQQKKLLEVKIEEYRKLKSKVDNLFEAISDEEDKIVRKGLTGKLKELQEELEKLELAISNFKAEQNAAFSGIGGGNVVDLSSVFMLLKSFKTGFEKADVSLQSEILRDLIHQIIVQEDGVKVKLYSVSGEFSFRKNKSNQAASCRTAVRSAFKLVEIIGKLSTT